MFTESVKPAYVVKKQGGGGGDGRGPLGLGHTTERGVTL